MSRLLDLFDQVYVVNLPSRADRRKEMAAQLERVGSSLVGRNVSLFPAIRPESADGFPSIGARGCFLSHLNILRDADARGLNRILILEDDLDFAPDFLQREGEVARLLEDAGWGLFYGGYVLIEPIGSAASGPVHALASTQGVRTTHFVGFQGEAIAEVITHLEAILTRTPGDPEGGPMHVDGAYSRFRAGHPDCRTLLATPELGDQRASRTDIHELQWYDRTPLIRNLVAILRRGRNREAS
ncbi:glycosyltransferase family 25 protein [Planctomyces sp. SH-PL62]|uniref:glycosyltransferase family 25 protein n=1 Tax=Planctomyces sp. SH-PL62 TaxID=1636152 RepID=UPI00078B2F31|nr:glycosyltransferase family 25 protein [Planctomyces sp. SH-PL62]AMV37088.1 Glycosyltransferase family 25 (LPS biosynthesis protein) [Planctomyces sp. SH-PL62]